MTFTITMMKAGYQVQVSYAMEDPAWDAFVVKTPGGRHFQSSPWARVKTVLGWEVVRVFVRQSGEIVAGAQMLLRCIPIFGTVGFASRGPLFAVDDLELREVFISGLLQIIIERRVQYLLVQPPCNGWPIAEELPKWGFHPSPLVTVAPTATVLIDLTRDIDEILAAMTPRTRQYIRSALRKGITIKEGTETDLPTFRHLLTATASRKKWSIFHKDYYANLWRILSPNNYVRLTLAEYQGEAVAALLIYPFGEGVYGKTIVSTGQHDNLGASELLLWNTLKWTKAQGHRYFDLGQVKPQVARAILSDESSIGSFKQRPAFFKFRVGGRPIFCPGAYVYIRNPGLRWAYNTVFPAISNSALVREIKQTIRGFNRR